MIYLDSFRKFVSCPSYSTFVHTIEDEITRHFHCANSKILFLRKNRLINYKPIIA